MKYRLTITEEYHRPAATFRGLPKLARGTSLDVELTKEQAASLAAKHGVKVEPASSTKTATKATKTTTEGGNE